MRDGYNLIVEVKGAMIMVPILSFISSGEIITHGLVFFISFPIVGLRFTQ